MAASDFLRFLLLELITDIDSLSISEKNDEKGTLVSIQVNPADMPIIIGRNGKTIEALRTMMRIYGAKKSLHISLRIEEDIKTL
jgi:predicted RNA-binding protein YlqC (UPF0109 family)